MKSRRFIVSLVACACAVSADACWEPAYETGTPLMYHFYNAAELGNTTESQKARNIALWQELANMYNPAGGMYIPAGDVEKAVYGTTLAELREAFSGGSYSGGNRFLEWLGRWDSVEGRNFLLLAKEVEELRAARLDAWYYPSDRRGYDRLSQEEARFEDVLRRCKAYLTKEENGRISHFGDRYAFQGMRVLRTLKRYQEAIDWYEEYMDWRDDSNLFKQMARHYLAGCLVNTGREREGEKIFAELGDFMSIGGADWEEKMAGMNPENGSFKSRLNGMIGYGDEIDNVYYLRVADAALSSPEVVHRGDWLYLKAFVEYHYMRDLRQSAEYISQALRDSFSTPEMAEDARVFDICVRADLDRTGRSLGEDVAWLYEHRRYDLRPLWLYVVPSLLRQGRRAEAMLVANVGTGRENTTVPFLWEMVDYSHPGVQMMLSGSVADMEEYMRLLRDGNGATVRRLRGLVNQDDDYLNEIAGTLCLREGRYEEAVRYLEKVSPLLQFRQGIYRDGYLDPDPFVYYDGVWDKRPVARYRRLDGESVKGRFDAKLRFGRRMVELERIMRTERDADKRAMAGLEYESGRYNSFTVCWALTQYWLMADGPDKPYVYSFRSWDTSREAGYLVNRPREYVSVVTDYAPHITKYRYALRGADAKAKVCLWMREYRTVARLYPDSPEGEYLASHCDGWEDWIRGR